MSSQQVHSNQTTYEMKDSGIEWIGDIPNDWEIKRVKHLFRLVTGATPKTDEKANWGSDLIWVTPADFGAKYLSSSLRELSLKGYNSCGTTLVPKNSILITCRAPIGSVALAAESLCFNQGCKALVNKKNNVVENYFYYYFASNSQALNSYGKGTTFLELSSIALNNFPIPNPPLHEQQAIANYLDEQVEKMDGLISAQKQAIEKWKDYKQSLITETVTKGLNPNVEMKDSGVEWIGMIPRDWAVKKLKYFATIFNGKETESREGDIPIYGSGGVVGFTNKCTYTGDSVLLGRKGTIDKPLFVSGPFWNIDTAFATRPKSGTNMKFFYYCCLTLIEFKKYISGSAIPSMTQTILNETILVAPPLQEQQAIADYLDEKCSKIDQTIEQKELLIKQLEEYKQSLIYECVTGKRRVL